MTDDPQADRPLATFALMAYNQEKFIREAVEGAFAQDYEPLEIILSDDCSTDGTFDIMQEMAETYKGNARVIVSQNTENLGLIGHVNQLFDACSGELIILAAGDDISFPNRTKCCVEYYNKLEDKRVLIHGDVIGIGEHGERLGKRSPPIKSLRPIDELALSRSLYIGATGAISRALIGSYEPIKFRKAYEDVVWGFRAALDDAFHYLPETLVYYRVGVGISEKGLHSNSFRSKVSRLHRSRLVMRDVLRQRILDLGTHGDDHGLLCQKMTIKMEKEAMGAKIWEKRLCFSDMFTYIFWFSVLREIRALFRLLIEHRANPDK